MRSVNRGRIAAIAPSSVGLSLVVTKSNSNKFEFRQLLHLRKS